MAAIAALVVGALIGFVTSRSLRRPQHAAQAASVARSVGGTLGRRKGLTAPELQRACFSEMVRHVQVDADGRPTVPTSYLLQLHPEDLATVDDARGWFVDGLSDALRTEARQQGWATAGRRGSSIDIRIEGDPSRKPGVPAALALDQPAPSPSGRLAVVRTDTGQRIALAGGELTIGRSDSCAIVIDDNRVSRVHARLTPGRSGWTIADAGSSNGTSLDGRLLTPEAARPVRAGSTIGIGPVELRIEGDGGGRR